MGWMDALNVDNWQNTWDKIQKSLATWAAKIPELGGSQTFTMNKNGPMVDTSAFAYPLGGGGPNPTAAPNPGAGPNPLPSPRPSPSLTPAAQPNAPVTPQPTTNPTPMPMPSNVPNSGDMAQRIRDFYQSKMPPSSTQSVDQYYPIMQYMPNVLQQESTRPGAGLLGMLQGFFESTGGRAGTNTFGAKPGGVSQGFPNIPAAIDYQYGPHVLGGGANPANMDILHNGTGPITSDDIIKLYKSYNPSGDYLNQLVQDYTTLLNSQGGQ